MEYLANLLIKDAVYMSNGVGWLIHDQSRPLAGVAHGNSGIAMAFARLWKFTNKKHYRDIIDKAIRYEDTLFDDSCANWMDIRGQDTGAGKDLVAWCHGSGGILMARKIIESDTGIQSNQKLVNMAGEKLMNTEKKDMCLCHGQAGLWMISSLLKRSMDLDVRRSGVKENNQEFIFKKLLVKNRNTPGFMTGIAGIGYAMLKCKREDFPGVIDLILK